MFVKDCNTCGTAAVKGLDRQLIAMTMRVCPSLLVPITDLNVSMGENVHPYLQASAKQGLFRAISKVGKKLEINSAWRTIAGQCLLYQQANKKVCGIEIAAYPGKSNHQSASAIDINDYQDWKEVLQENGWRWLGAADAVHFDYINCIDIRERSVIAFQRLWNLFNDKKLVEDGIMGALTFEALSNAPCDGFCSLNVWLPDRFLKPNLNQSGKDVLFVQNLLLSLGIEVSNNGSFDAQTVSGVKIFQARSSLLVDGIVGDKTWKLINNFEIGDSHNILVRH